jgi:WD40 repeat protein
MLVASGGEDRLVLVWRAADGHLLLRFEHAGAVGALYWSANGEQLLIGGTDGVKGALSLWDARQGALLRTFEGHSGFIWGIDWAHEHDLLVSAGTDGTVRWWNPKLGVLLATVQAHDGWARAVRISPDGQTVASCGEDGTIRLWDVRSHQHQATLRAERPYERLDISHTRGLTNAQKAALRALGAVDAEHGTPP